MTDCDVCWNTHGCDLPKDHGGVLHHCLLLGTDPEPCSLILWDEEEGAWIRWDAGERIGPVRAFHARALDPMAASATVGEPE